MKIAVLYVLAGSSTYVLQKRTFVVGYGVGRCSTSSAVSNPVGATPVASDWTHLFRRETCKEEKKWKLSEGTIFNFSASRDDTVLAGLLYRIVYCTTPQSPAKTR